MQFKEAIWPIETANGQTYILLQDQYTWFSKEDSFPKSVFTQLPLDTIIIL